MRWVNPLGLSCKDGTDEIHVSHNTNKSVGHNYIGITLPGQEAEWLDLVVTEPAGGLVGLIKGGNDTMLRRGAKISKKMKVSTRKVDVDRRERLCFKLTI